MFVSYFEYAYSKTTKRTLPWTKELLELKGSVEEKTDLVLKHGSLLVMKDTTQSNWVHRLPPTKLVLKPRVNLTFRTIVKK